MKLEIIAFALMALWCVSSFFVFMYWFFSHKLLENINTSSGLGLITFLGAYLFICVFGVFIGANFKNENALMFFGLVQAVITGCLMYGLIRSEVLRKEKIKLKHDNKFYKECFFCAKEIHSWYIATLISQEQKIKEEIYALTKHPYRGDYCLNNKKYRSLEILKQKRYLLLREIDRRKTMGEDE